MFSKQSETRVRGWTEDLAVCSYASQTILMLPLPNAEAPAARRALGRACGHERQKGKEKEAFL